MFFNQRSLQAEYFDSPDRPSTEVAESYALLAGINSFFMLAKPYERRLPGLIGQERCKSLSILDLGAGDGSLGNELTAWAGARGWNWRMTNVDVIDIGLRLNSAGANVVGSALQLPFRDGAFDVVIASQMTHHLMTAEDVAAHFREAWRVTRGAVFITDLHRNAFLYMTLWVWLLLRRVPGHFRSDGLLSVRRGWRLGEWREMAAKAGMTNARVWLYGGARIVLQARKN